VHDFQKASTRCLGLQNTHIVWCPKYRFQILQGEVGQSMRAIIRGLCRQKQIEILEDNVQVDHIHLVVSIPPKYSVSYVVGFLKGKSAVAIFDRISQLKKAVLGAPLLGTRILRGHGGAQMRR